MAHDHAHGHSHGDHAHGDHAHGDHAHGDHAHGHHHGAATGRVLSRALLVTLVFAVVETGAGIWSGSLALLSDAGHMVTDSFSLALAAGAAWISRRPVNRRLSWGLGRAEVVAAVANALLMLAIVVVIVISAIERLRAPLPISPWPVMVVAALGLLVNLAVLRILSHDHGNLNVRGAVLHVMGDLLGSVAALVSGMVVLATGWLPIDPLLSLLICALILVSALRLLRDSLHVVMEGVPPHLDLARIGQAMARVPGVAGVHDLHIWEVRSGQVALSAHVMLWRMDDWMAALGGLQGLLGKDYRIHHVTLQPELVPEIRVPVPPPGSRAP